MFESLEPPVSPLRPKESRSDAWELIERERERLMTGIQITPPNIRGFSLTTLGNPDVSNPHNTSVEKLIRSA